MKKLFLKTLVLSLALSNVSLDYTKTINLSSDDKKIIASLSVIAGLVVLLLYRNYKNMSEFIDYFDQTFGTKEEGGIEKLSKSINQKLLDKGISQQDIDKLAPKLNKVIRDLKNGVGKDVLNLKKGDINLQQLTDFVNKTNEILKTSAEKNFGLTKTDFKNDLMNFIKEGPYGLYLGEEESYFSGISQIRSSSTENPIQEEEFSGSRSSSLYSGIEPESHFGESYHEPTYELPSTLPHDLY